eukprot:Sdes_comp21949_c0_seq1m20492
MDPMDSSSCTDAALKEALDAIETAIEQYDVKQALEWSRKALEYAPNDIRVLETCGAIYVESGHADEAFQCLMKAAKLYPETGHSKFLYLGQLTDGQESLGFYNQGIHLISVKLSQNNLLEDAQRKQLVQDFVSALCAAADIFMTDLCFEPNADSECFALIQRALEAQPDSYEALQTQANYLISKEKPEEALMAIHKSFSLWMHPDSTLDAPPSIPFRITTAKILIELQEKDKAFEVLEALLKEDDEIIEVWYLM